MLALLAREDIDSFDRVIAQVTGKEIKRENKANTEETEEKN
jgi:hypothetical protein